VGFEFWPEADPNSPFVLKKPKEIHNEVAKSFASFVRCLMIRHKLEKMPLGVLSCFLHEAQRWACRHRRNMKWALLMKETSRMIDRIVDAYLETQADTLPDLHVIDEKLQRWMNADSAKEKMRPVTVRSLEYFALQAEFIETQEIVLMLEEASRYITRPQTEDKMVPMDDQDPMAVTKQRFMQSSGTGTMDIEEEGAQGALSSRIKTAISSEGVDAIGLSAPTNITSKSLFGTLQLRDKDLLSGKEDIVLGQVSHDTAGKFLHTQDYNIRAFRAHSRELRDCIAMPRLWNGGITMESLPAESEGRVPEPEDMLLSEPLRMMEAQASSSISRLTAPEKTSRRWKQTHRQQPLVESLLAWR
jgi:hypothetical protein